MTSPAYGSSLPNYTYAAFNSYEVATQAIAALIDHGFDKDRITVILREQGKDLESVSSAPLLEETSSGLSLTTVEDAREGAGRGAGIGLGIGVLAGLVSLIVPGAGIVVGGGALVTAIGGAIAVGAAGVVVGAVTGYLVDQGVDPETVHSVMSNVQDGNIVVGIDVLDPTSRDLVHNLLAKYEGFALLRATQN